MKYDGIRSTHTHARTDACTQTVCAQRMVLGLRSPNPLEMLKPDGTSGAINTDLKLNVITSL